MKSYSITCFDIGGSAIKCASATQDGQIGALRRVPTPTNDFAAFAGAMRQLIDELNADHGAAGDGPSQGVAISIAGVIDPADGRIKCANIPCIDGRTPSIHLVNY